MLDVVVFLVGLWIIITAKIPSGLLAKKDYKIDNKSSRYLGAIFLIPAPLNLFIGIVFVLLGIFETYKLLLIGLDILIIVGTIVLINFLAQRISQSVTANDGLVEK